MASLLSPHLWLRARPRPSSALVDAGSLSGMPGTTFGGTNRGIGLNQTRHLQSLRSATSHMKARSTRWPKPGPELG